MYIKGFIKRACCFAVLVIFFSGVTSCKKNNDIPASSVQVINADTDAGPVNFYLSGKLETKAPVSYGNYSDYLSVVAGNQTAQIKTAANSATVASMPVNLVQGAHYSIFLCGQSAADSLSSMVVQDDLSAPTPGEAELRCVNTVANSNVEFTVAYTNYILFYKDVAYKAATYFRDKLTPGSYSIAVTPYGPAYTTPGVSVTFATANVTLVSGKIYTIYFKGHLGTTTGDAKMDLGIIVNN